MNNLIVLLFSLAGLLLFIGFWKHLDAYPTRYRVKEIESRYGNYKRYIDDILKYYFGGAVLCLVIIIILTVVTKSYL